MNRQKWRHGYMQAFILSTNECIAPSVLQDPGSSPCDDRLHALIGENSLYMSEMWSFRKELLKCHLRIPGESADAWV